MSHTSLLLLLAAPAQPGGERSDFELPALCQPGVWRLPGAGVTGGGDAKSVVVDGGATVDGDVHVGGILDYFYARGARFDGDVQAGAIDRAYYSTTNGITSTVTTDGGGTDGHLGLLMSRYGAIDGAVTVAGDAGRIYAYRGTTANGTIRVGENLDVLYSGTTLRGHVDVSNGLARWIYVRGDLDDANIFAQELTTVIVNGRIRSATGNRTIRATALGSAFYVGDSTRSGTVRAGVLILFDGGNVIAQVV